MFSIRITRNVFCDGAVNLATKRFSSSATFKIRNSRLLQANRFSSARPSFTLMPKADYIIPQFKIQNPNRCFRRFLSESKEQATRSQQIKQAAEKRVDDAKVAGQKGASRIRLLFKEYGLIAFTVYFGVYFAALGSMFLMVSNGIIPKGNTEAIFAYFGMQEQLKSAKKTIGHYVSPYFKKKSDAEVDDDVLGDTVAEYINSFVTAWLLTKVTEPLRLLLAVGLVPVVAKIIRRR